MLTPFVTVGALILGYYIWIDQTKLKRRFEVAEKIMLAFINASDTLDFARSDFFTEVDTKDREKEPNESDREARIKNRWYVVLKRLADRRDSLNSLRESELLGALYLGKPAKDAIAEMWSIVSAVRTSAQMLIMTASDQIHIKELPTENRASFNKQVKRWEVDCSKLLFLSDQNSKKEEIPNPINARIEAARAKLKKVCGPYLSTADL